MKGVFTPTLYDTKKAVQAISGTSIAQGNSQNSQSTMSAPGSGTASTGKPQHISQIPIGIRYGTISRVKINSNDDFRYEVIFPSTGTKVWARKLGNGAISSIYDGKVVNGILYPSETVTVGAVVDNQAFTWTIISEEEPSITADPGTVTIVKGDSSFSLQDDNIKITNGNSSILIKSDSIVIDSPSVTINGEST